MTDEFPISPFAYDAPGPFFAVAEASLRLAEPGFPSDVAAGRLRRWALQGLVFANGLGPRGARLFALHDLVVAKVLSELTDLGIVDLDVLQAASLGLYSGKPGGEAPHAVQDAILAVQRRAWPTFHLEVWRSPSGERRVVASIQEILATGGQMVRTPDVGRMLGEGWVVRTALSIELAPLILLVFTPREAMN